MKPASEMTLPELRDEIAWTRLHLQSKRLDQRAKFKSRYDELRDDLARREMPPSVPDADYIAAKVAEFDRDFPIPRIDAQPPILTSASRVHGACGMVCSEGNESAARLPRA